MKLEEWAIRPCHLAHAAIAARAKAGRNAAAGLV